jgi:hypothetical protein
VHQTKKGAKKEVEERNTERVLVFVILLLLAVLFAMDYQWITDSIGLTSAADEDAPCNPAISSACPTLYFHSQSGPSTGRVWGFQWITDSIVFTSPTDQAARMQNAAANAGAGFTAGAVLGGAFSNLAAGANIAAAGAAGAGAAYWEEIRARAMKKMKEQEKYRKEEVRARAMEEQITGEKAKRGVP